LIAAFVLAAFVPVAPAEGVAPSAAEAASGLEINTATRARLESIRGIGPTLAEAILAARQERLFTDWEDVVRRIHGVGPASARRLSAAGLRVAGRAFGEAPDSPETGATR
jgi:competence protein ComEA